MNSFPRALYLAAVVAAAVMLFDQLFELAVSIYPFHLRMVQWRFGAYGLLVGRTTAFVFADMLLVLGIVGLDRRRLLRGWGILHLAVAGLLLPVMGLFALDALEMRQTVRSGVEGPLALAAVRVVLVGAVALGYLLWTGITVLRATAERSRRRDRNEGAPVMMSQTTDARRG